MVRHKGITEERYENVEREKAVAQPRLGFCQRHSKTGMILVVVLCSCLMAVAVPYLVNRYGFDLPLPSDDSNLGTCRINSGFLVDCLPEKSDKYIRTVTGMRDCEGRGCCYDNTTETPCYHQLPSYQYSSRIEETSAESIWSGVLTSPHMFDDQTSSPYYRVFSPGQDDHLIIEIDDQQGEVDGDENFGNISVKIGCPQYLAPEECAANSDVFTFQLQLDNTPIARSNFGPLMVSEDMSEVSLYLSGPRILSYGMPEFVWNRERHVTQFYINQHSSVHLPLVIGMLPSMEWFLLHLETNYPGEVVINPGTNLRPVVTWRTMGGPVRLHIVTGETLPVLLKKQADMRGEVLAPSTPSLGYQLCRDTGHPRGFKQDVEGMQSAKIQFDGDCIDQQLIKEAFSLNTESFSSSLNNQANILGDNKFFSLPLVVQRRYDNQTGESQGCLKEENSTSSPCFMGNFYNQRVMFPDMGQTDWMSPEFDNLQNKLAEYDLKASDTDSLVSCPGFRYVPRGVDLRDGLVCQRAWVSSLSSSLVEQHTSYGLEMSRAINQLVQGQAYQFSAQYSYGSEVVGGYMGSSSPATWDGLADSLREVLMLGLAGQAMVSMPVCGTHQVEEVTGDDLDTDLLCLRWGQLAAFMPSLRSWYSGTDNSRMPYRLALQYQEYLQWSLERRYQLLPYMITLQQDWTSSGLPLVRPMFLHYPESLMFGLWSQFMLGPDLVVSAVTSPDQTVVRLRLPAGSWYDLYSGIKYQSPSSAVSLAVQAQAYEIPAFQRGGSVLLIYKALSPDLGQSGQQYLDNQTQMDLKIALECSGGPRQLETCEASSSLDWLIDGLNSSLSVNVTSLGGEGSISLNPSGTTNKTLDIIFISGLQPSPALSFRSSAWEARECEEGTAVPCWSQQQDVVLLRKINLPLKDNISIEWQDPVSTSTSPPSTSSPTL